MDQLQQLGDPATLLRQLFTPTVLLWALIGTVVSGVSFAAYRRGKKSKRRVLVFAASPSWSIRTSCTIPSR